MKLHKISKPTKHKKCKLLLDENLPSRVKFPRLNGRFEMSHIVHDLNMPGIKDDRIFAIAEEKGLIIITRNTKDFATKIRYKSGLIGISPNLSDNDIDTKVTSILTKHKDCYLIGRFISITH